MLSHKLAPVYHGKRLFKGALLKRTFCHKLSTMKLFYVSGWDAREIPMRGEGVFFFKQLQVHGQLPRQKLILFVDVFWKTSWNLEILVFVEKRLSEISF